MERDTVIEITGLGKKYAILHEQGRYVAFRDVLVNIAKSPLRFLATKTRQALGKEGSDEVWALQNVNLSIKRGEVIGVVGKNGAGKSTLLKILSQITPPTTGEVCIRGRVGSLLEVGTGFHPELTGRENIFLNGAILGMSKKEIVNRFDEIVEFAGVSRFLDTPVKHYSSGMYVRLAFSVAAHMEPDVLIIDEVLAVGDAEFQKKCIDRMRHIAENGDRTVLFVSHNMQSVSALCTKAILIKNGTIDLVGPTETVLKRYMEDTFTSGSGHIELEERSHGEATFTDVTLKNGDDVETSIIPHSHTFTIDLGITVKEPISNADVSVLIKSARGVDVAFLSLSDESRGALRDFSVGHHSLSVSCEGGFLMPDNYYLRISIHNPGHANIDTREDILGFQIINDTAHPVVNYGIGCVTPKSVWRQT